MMAISKKATTFQGFTNDCFKIRALLTIALKVISLRAVFLISLKSLLSLLSQPKNS